MQQYQQIRILEQSKVDGFGKVKVFFKPVVVDAKPTSNGSFYTVYFEQETIALYEGKKGRTNYGWHSDMMYLQLRGVPEQYWHWNVYIEDEASRRCVADNMSKGVARALGFITDDGIPIIGAEHPNATIKRIKFNTRQFVGQPCVYYINTINKGSFSVKIDSNGEALTVEQLKEYCKKNNIKTEHINEYWILKEFYFPRYVLDFNNEPDIKHNLLGQEVVEKFDILVKI